MTTKSAQQNHFVAITKYFPQYINSKVLFYEELPTYGIHITWPFYVHEEKYFSKII